MCRLAGDRRQGGRWVCFVVLIVDGVVLVVGGVVLIVDGCGFGCRWVWFWLQAGVVLVVVGWGFGYRSMWY